MWAQNKNVWKFNLLRIVFIKQLHVCLVECLSLKTNAPDALVSPDAMDSFMQLIKKYNKTQIASVQLGKTLDLNM